MRDERGVVRLSFVGDSLEIGGESHFPARWRRREAGRALDGFAYSNASGFVKRFRDVHSGSA